MTPPITATYRLQLHSGVPLVAARDLVDYLDRLGISHLYSSPLLRARSGSTHGYDVVDPTTLDPELGTEADLDALVAALADARMALVLDIVPNHMAASDENPFWDDVLAHGPSSSFARWFDVDWGDGRVILPVLGDQRARVLARGELALAWSGTGPRVRYFAQTFPLDPATVPAALAEARLGARLAPLAALPPRRARDASRRARAAEAMGALAAAYAEDGSVRAAVDGALAAASADRVRLAALLDAQAYRLVYWRRAAGEINYRRFFNVSDLVGVRVEDPTVFAATHARIADWLGRGRLAGLRVDHVDGLWDPAGYLERLRGLAGGVPVWVEKILTGDERLPDDWPVAGTTGYEFAGAVEAAFIDPAGFAAIEAAYRTLIGAAPTADFAAAARAGKRRLVETWFFPDVRRLARDLIRLAGDDSRVTPRDLETALIATMIAFPVYRTYLTESRRGTDAERAAIETALDGARRTPGVSAPALEVLASLLRGDHMDARAFVHRFQQTTGPVMAKGVEDTALYRWVPLVSRNEVGGDPGAPLANAVEALHDANMERAARWPLSILATTTHDTKRSADVRARLDVLSEMPERWLAQVAAWRRLNRVHRRRVRGRYTPDANTEYLFHQTVVGAWPLADDDPAALTERVAAYMQKAIREAKVQTSWLDPDPEYERAVDDFVRAALAPGPFRDGIATFVRDIARAGLWTALARTLVHLTSPGVPDVYQGDELWNFALTDPDNRRPVAFAARRALLDDLEARPADAAALVASPEDGRIKLHVVRTALRLRRVEPERFASGYRELVTEGAAASHVLAFARGDATITIVPRLVWSLARGGAPVGAVWGDTTIRLPAESGR
ncbi:MAG TPA: malto-oligosyltrehalose synthase, partial [Candidatus Binatia bacterium]|nr:malto-oligosyltrehalose synthase [Candidatus Binatia bacterium]